MTLPTLMTHLNREYEKFIRNLDQLSRPKYAGVEGFSHFCEKYLAEINPAIESFFPANSIGLRLADNTRVVLAGGPGVQASGQMQDSQSVGVTTGDESIAAGEIPI
jgi:hypothetical protein